LASGVVSLRPYADGDMWILEQTLGDPRLMVHLNGPESPEKILERHRRFVAMSADPRLGRMFTVLVGASAAGNVGYWETDWDGEKVWETGWFVLPGFQGRGVATEATRLLIGVVSMLEGHGSLVATPSVSNAPSNAIAKRLNFALIREVDSEYPPGSGKHLRCNVWRLALPASPRKE
jgi:RimJ/RimL family protein N-acetyltransferase